MDLYTDISATAPADKVTAAEAQIRISNFFMHSCASGWPTIKVKFKKV